MTVNGQGTAASTLQAFDSIDGGAGTDTLNLYATATENNAQTGTIKNVEIINIINGEFGVNEEFGGATAIDASKFEGATQIWQVNSDNDTGITKLAAGVTAGFRNMEGNTLNVDVAAAATTLNVALDNVDDASSLVVTAPATSKLAAATISGAVVDSGTDGVDAINVTVEAGLNVKTFTFTTEVDVNLTLNENTASTVVIETLDGSASTGAINVTTDSDLLTTKTGAGDDTVTLGADLVADASVTTNAGDDTVDLAGNDVNKGATVSLGAGDDNFADLTGGSVVDKDAVIDGGDGSDALQLQLVGAANVGAFKNFEIFDVIGLSHDIDLDILASKNTVTKITANGAAGASSVLENVGAGVSYEVQGDMDANSITLTQKTAGALTITSNVDETAADAAANTSDAVVVASNATSLNIVFDNNNVDTLADGYANTAQLDVTAGSGDNSATVKGATSVTVVSGGTEVVNTLNLTAVATSATGTAELLTSITVTGDQALVLDRVASAAGTLKLATVDASGQTDGGLTFNLADLTSTGTLKLGAGDDVITGKAITTTASTTATIQTINGLEKGTVENAATQDGFDVLVFGSAIQAGDDSTQTEYTLANGLVTWSGAGPANLTAAVAILNGDLTANETVVFSLGGSDYFVYGQGASVADTDDVLIKLTGVTSVAGIDTVGAGNDLYLF